MQVRNCVELLKVTGKGGVRKSRRENATSTGIREDVGGSRIRTSSESSRIRDDFSGSGNSRSRTSPEPLQLRK